MLKQAIAALGEPVPFFRWLATRPARPSLAYVVLLLVALLSSLLGLAVLFTTSSPQADQFQSLMDQAGIPVARVAWLFVGLAPIGALLSWPLIWLPIRLGAGPAERLWEVAGWSQLPQLAICAVQGAVAFLWSADPAFSAALSAAGLAWCTWFVYAGVSELGRGRALRAAAFYALVWAVPVAIALVSAFAWAPPPSGELMS